MKIGKPYEFLTQMMTELYLRKIPFELHVKEAWSCTDDMVSKKIGLHKTIWVEDLDGNNIELAYERNLSEEKLILDFADTIDYDSNNRVEFAIKTQKDMIAATWMIDALYSKGRSSDAD